MKLLNLVIVLGIVLALFAPMTANAAEPPVCPDVKDASGNPVEITASGFAAYAHVDSKDVWTVPTNPGGLTVDYRQDSFGVNFHFQPGMQVPAGRATFQGCHAASDTGKGYPVDATKVVCPVIAGVTYSTSYDQYGKVEQGAAWADSTVEWTVPANMVAHVHGGDRVLAGKTVPANTRATLFGCVPAGAAQVMPNSGSGLSPEQADRIDKILDALEGLTLQIEEILKRLDP